MFTGIIAGLGEVTISQRLGNERRLRIQPLFAMQDMEDGESIAVNGACLSVENHGSDNFTAYASAETIERTNLGSLRPGAKVNLERALKVGERLGGHIVSGHVDCLATVAKVARAGESLALKLTFPSQFGSQVIAKGSVALNGISLTINECGKDYLAVNIIPDSQERTNILAWRPGDLINMETDIIGKYVQSLLKPWEKGEQGRLTKEFLAVNGFI